MGAKAQDEPESRSSDGCCMAVPLAGYESGSHTLKAGPQIIHMIRARVLGDHIHSIRIQK